MPHFDQYAAYIWWAYGVVIAGLAMAVIYIIGAYWRAYRIDKMSGAIDER